MHAEAEAQVEQRRGAVLGRHRLLDADLVRLLGQQRRHGRPVLAEAGRIDVLVNNTGVMPLGRFLDEPDAISRATLDVNVWG